MRKFLGSTITIMVLFTLLIGCESMPEPVTVGIEQSGQSVSLQVGQTMIVRLESNPTTGYTWEVKQVDPAVLAQQGEAEYETLETQTTPMVGQGGWQVFRFEAISTGQTPLEMVYRRPWEDAPPESSFTLQVMVN